MIINTGQRCDIPAFYSTWFFNRIKDGFVYVRNPLFPHIVYKYILDPSVVDCICFCSKNPAPMFSRLSEISQFNQYWFVTITPYGKDIEPNVKDKKELLNDFIYLAKKVGRDCIALRYDPIFITFKYSIEYHIRAFETICKTINPYCNTIIISFIDLYKKVIQNFKNVKEVSEHEKEVICQAFVNIAKQYNIHIKTCCEGEEFKKYGIDVSGCQTKEVLEKAIKKVLIIPKNVHSIREGCNCLIGHDIGQYDTCNHQCKYCYACNNTQKVLENMKNHDPNSPILIGHLREDDQIIEVKQKSYLFW